jgi:methionyl-tRNA formyltransferase
MIVMVAGTGESTRILYHALARHLDIARVFIEQPVSHRQLLSRRLAKLGWLTVAGQVAFKGTAVPLLARLSRDRVRQIKADFHLDDSPIPPAKVVEVPSVNDSSTVSMLRDLRPTVVVVTGTRIISRDVLREVPAPFVNIHVGITPEYRGVHGAYWALVDGKPQACGVTVHLVDEGIDTGAILGQAVVQPTARDNFVTYPYLQVAAGIPLLVEAVQSLANGAPPRPAPARGSSKLRTHPTLRQYLHYRLTRGVR